MFLPFGKNLPSTNHHIHRLLSEWVDSPQPLSGTESSHYYSPMLFWHGNFLYIMTAVWVVEYTLIDHLHFVFMYLLLDLNHCLLPLYTLSQGCTLCSDVLCINILEIYRSVLYFLYYWVLIIKTFTLGY